MAKRSIGKFTGDPVTYKIPAPAGGVQLVSFIPWTLVKRSVRREIITPIGSPKEFEPEVELEMQNRKTAQVTPLLRALGLAHHWQQLLDDGKVRSVSDIAESEKVSVTHVRRLLRLVLLAPKLIDAIMADHGKRVTLELLMRQPMPADWQTQQTLFS